MTYAQSDIKRYIESRFSGGFKLVPIGDYVLQLIDCTGDVMDFTCNLFGDIMEAGSKKILAVSDLPHDLCKLSISARPSSWVDQPYFN